MAGVFWYTNTSVVDWEVRRDFEGGHASRGQYVGQLVCNDSVSTTVVAMWKHRHQRPPPPPPPYRFQSSEKHKETEEAEEGPKEEAFLAFLTQLAVVCRFGRRELDRSCGTYCPRQPNPHPWPEVNTWCFGYDLFDRKSNPDSWLL